MSKNLLNMLSNSVILNVDSIVPNLEVDLTCLETLSEQDKDETLDRGGNDPKGLPLGSDETYDISSENNSETLVEFGDSPSCGSQNVFDILSWNADTDAWSDRSDEFPAAHVVPELKVSGVDDVTGLVRDVTGLVEHPGDSDVYPNDQVESSVTESEISTSDGFQRDTHALSDNSNHGSSSDEETIDSSQTSEGGYYVYDSDTATESSQEQPARTLTSCTASSQVVPDIPFVEE